MQIYAKRYEIENFYAINISTYNEKHTKTLNNTFICNRVLTGNA